MNKCTNKLVRKKLNIKAIMNNTPICENLLRPQSRTAWLMNPHHHVMAGHIINAFHRSRKYEET